MPKVAGRLYLVELFMRAAPLIVPDFDRDELEKWVRSSAMKAGLVSDTTGAAEAISRDASELVTPGLDDLVGQTAGVDEHHFVSSGHLQKSKQSEPARLASRKRSPDTW